MTTDGDRPAGQPGLLFGPSLPAGGKPVQQVVAEYAITRPDRPAVQDGDRALSYVELERLVGTLAGRLVGAGVRSGDRVAILAEPKAAAIGSLLAVLRLGAAYVPIDPAQPAKRIAAILAEAKVSAVMVSERTGSLVDGGAPAVVPMDGADMIGFEPPGPVGVRAEDAAYVIYTSGSTGEPRGVLVEHASLTASTRARRMAYPGAPTFLLVSPLAFDSSAAGVWGTLTAGGCLVVAGSEQVRDPERLVRLLDRHAATSMLCVPSLYGAVLDAAQRLGTRLRSVSTMIVAGETLPQAMLERHFEVLPGVELVNEYGPTETTVWASLRRYREPAPSTIGTPIPGARLYVLDGRLRPVPAGVDGELFIGGPGVARGYVDRPAATARNFLPDPFAGRGGARMYRTGDVARVNAAGELDFLGRRDDQLKIRGHRVELAAVQGDLLKTPGVRAVAALPDPDRSGVVAFVVPEGAATSQSVRREAESRMPPAMVPSRVILVDSIPVTVNGKVDRAGLRDLAAQPPSPPAPIVGDSETAMVAAAWSEVLDMADVPIDMNFFDLGGHSLTIFKLQDALHRHAGVRPSMTALFEHVTVAAQAALIRGRTDGDGAATA